MAREGHYYRLYQAQARNVDTEMDEPPAPTEERSRCRALTSDSARNGFGRLVFTDADGKVQEGVVPVRAFPLAAPDEGIALVGADGHEVAWIDRLADLPADSRTLIDEELASREFMPEIRRIADVSSFATPSTWRVTRDRGERRSCSRARRTSAGWGGSALLIADSHGIHFLIRDVQALDRTSRRLLDRFL